MSNGIEAQYFAQQQRLRANFYRDNFRRLVWVNIFLCCSILVFIGVLMIIHENYIVPERHYYVTTTKGQLEPINMRLTQPGVRQ